MSADSTAIAVIRIVCRRPTHKERLLVEVHDRPAGVAGIVVRTSRAGRNDPSRAQRPIVGGRMTLACASDCPTTLVLLEVNLQSKLGQIAEAFDAGLIDSRVVTVDAARPATFL